jgi:hypothetical protein
VGFVLVVLGATRIPIFQFAVLARVAGVLPRWAGALLGLGSIVAFFGGNPGLFL